MPVQKAGSVDSVNTAMMNCRWVFLTSGSKFHKMTSYIYSHVAFVSPNLFWKTPIKIKPINMAMTSHSGARCETLFISPQLSCTVLTKEK